MLEGTENDGLVRYDAETNTLYTTGYLQGAPFTIKGDGSTNVEMSNSDGLIVNQLTVTDAGDVTITGSGAPTAFSADTTCSGDVTISGSGAPTVNGDVNINCSGDVKLSSTDQMVVNAGKLTITDAKDVTVETDSTAPAISSTTDITCSGMVQLINKGTGRALAATLTYGQPEETGRAYIVQAGASVDGVSLKAKGMAGESFSDTFSDSAILITPTGFIVTLASYDGSEPIILYTDADGQLTALPAPTRSGYRFDGWFTSKEGGEKVTETAFTADITLYAHWMWDIVIPSRPSRPSVTAPETGWVQLSDGSWEYHGADGTALTGWQKVNGSWYYLNADGSMKANGWVQWNGVWYYLTEDGSMAANQWVLWKGVWYYLTADGSMAVSTVIDGWKVDTTGAWIR
ncbi:MAG: InlB B-repeat-containing protein [Oscillospiraceae bacterium]|nr:InlB B-repeat-containing protein [Oscillospiraceae bacterium]